MTGALIIMTSEEFHKPPLNTNPVLRVSRARKASEIEFPEYPRRHYSTQARAIETSLMYVEFKLISYLKPWYENPLPALLFSLRTSFTLWKNSGRLIWLLYGISVVKRRSDSDFPIARKLSNGT